MAGGRGRLGSRAGRVLGAMGRALSGGLCDTPGVQSQPSCSPVARILWPLCSGHSLLPCRRPPCRLLKRMRNEWMLNECCLPTTGFWLPGLWNLLAAEGEFWEQVPPEASPWGSEPPAWASPWQQHTSKPVLPVATERAAPRTGGTWREDFTVRHTPSASAPPCATLLGDAMGHRGPATAGTGGRARRLLICRLANEAVFVTLKPRGLIQKRR